MSIVGLLDNDFFFFNKIFRIIDLTMKITTNRTYLKGTSIIYIWTCSLLAYFEHSKHSVDHFFIILEMSYYNKYIF